MMLISSRVLGFVKVGGSIRGAVRCSAAEEEHQSAQEESENPGRHLAAARLLVPLRGSSSCDSCAGAVAEVGGPNGRDAEVRMARGGGNAGTGAPPRETPWRCSRCGAQATDEEEERSDTVRRWWLRRLDHRRRRRARVELGLRGFYAAGHRGSIYISRAAGIDRTFRSIRRVNRLLDRSRATFSWRPNNPASFSRRRRASLAPRRRSNNPASSLLFSDHLNF